MNNPNATPHLLPWGEDYVVSSTLINNAHRVISKEGAITADEHRDLQNIFALIGSSSWSVAELGDIS